MRTHQFIYLATLVLLTGFLTACSGGQQNTNKEAAKVENQKMSGTVILQDAHDYADQQCVLRRREVLLKNNPNTKDLEIKLKELNLERKKLKNYYFKKYEGMPEERAMFKKAVKAARIDSKYCKEMPVEKRK
ncbi:MAG: hypothetical protein L3J66_12105 [Bacteroidales bacterium]|nr:hypothetical protein [Bacteroidales bacterium]